MYFTNQNRLFLIILIQNLNQTYLSLFHFELQNFGHPSLTYFVFQFK